MDGSADRWLDEAAALARAGVDAGLGGPFGAVIVRDGAIVGRGENRVVGTHDPTAHAEVVAIRDACARLGRFELGDCTLYATCEPCPMCAGAIHWARLGGVVYAATRDDAAAAGFDDARLHDAFARGTGVRPGAFVHVVHAPSVALFDRWRAKTDRTPY